MTRRKPKGHRKIPRFVIGRSDRKSPVHLQITRNRRQPSVDRLAIVLELGTNGNVFATKSHRRMNGRNHPANEPARRCCAIRARRKSPNSRRSPRFDLKPSHDGASQDTIAQPRSREATGQSSGKNQFAEKMVPLARLERARLSTTDFESVASTIPPQGHISRART